ncbi:uncharacterized protein C8orf74 homolog isoform X1 [Astyanax mexicanus]|uniref:Uncharacterized protein n=2 Tax=Astyanax mexicanus TaxID=7994 RepID=A0A8T2LAJ5_ASTMX|nr:uncharacterized protein C8orf74 homolog isoform X1 [Astyanax mexicanus]KAG9268723.1 hypothetical protein AMEX_G17723 [Astyanax mexicanus]
MATASTENVLKELSRLERDEGIQRLSFCFQWREFEGDEQRQYLHQEFVYENVMYSVKRGLPWSSVAQVASMTKELLPELKGLERSEVISLIRTRLSQHQLQLSPAHRAVLYDFIVKDSVRHHHLYQAFLKKDINLISMDSQLEIHIPPHPPPLCEGTDVVVWEKQQALRELTAAEAEKQSELQRLREQAETELMAKLQERLGDLLVENRLDRQEVQTTVRTFLQSQGEFFKDNLEKEIRTVQELLEIKMRQKSLLGRGPSSNTSSFSEKLSVPSSTKVKKSKK